MTDNPSGALDVRGNGYFNGSLRILAEQGIYSFDGSYVMEVDGASSGQDLFLFENDNGQLLKLNADGTLYAKEVRVRVPPFPDYVFTPNYDLMPLLELSLFIEKNGHLPKMPTQEKVAEEGVNVGELNVLLTEKVEELTLYTIEQEERINQLEEQILKLEELINCLAD